jgi:hypothetical protein
MRIAYCLTGFARVLHSRDVISQSIKRSIPTGSQVHLFWFCPRQLDPDDPSTFVDENVLLSSFQCEPFRQVTIVWFDYTPSIFYKDANDLPFSVDDIRNASRSIFRTFSQVYNISKSVELCYNSGIQYDTVIITRNDYIPYVHKYAIQSNLKIGTRRLKQGIYAYRTYPYRTGRSDVILHTEDRAFYGTHNEMMNFRNFYAQLPKVFTSAFLIPEMIHTKFLCSVIPETQIYYQEDIKFGFPPNRPTQAMYRLTEEEKQVLDNRSTK